MRGLTSTIVLIVVLAGLGGYIYFVDSKRPAPGIDGSAAKEKVFALAPDDVEEFTLAFAGEKSVLKKGESGWRMVEPAATEADTAEATSIGSALANLELVRIVDENPKDLAQFGLEKPAIRVDFKAKNNVTGSLKLGDKNATQGEMYAQKNDETRVFLVSSFQETNFNRKPFDLRDKKILKFDSAKTDSLTIARGAQSIELARAGSEWKLVRPAAARSDYSAVEGLLTKLSSSNMSKLLEDDAKDLAKYGLDKPEMTITIGTGSAKTVLLVGKTENDQTYAKDAARPLVFTVDTTLQGDLKKDLAEYRKKELFEFRPFMLTRLRAVLDAPGGPKVHELEKVNDGWNVTRAGAPAFKVDQAAVDDLLNKLVAIKAESWADAKAKTGLEKPALVVSASYDDGKFERVRFGQVGENAFGARDGEAGAAKIDKTSMEAAMLAFDTVVMPPKP
jgi:hypothetical protein